MAHAVGDIGGELGAIDNAHIVHKAQDEAADTAVVAHLRVEEPAPIVEGRDIALGEGVLLDKEVAREHAELEAHAVLIEARHAEDVYIAAIVLSTMLPRLVEHIDRAYTRSLEELIHATRGLEAPHLNIVGSEGEGLYPTVADDARMRRGIVAEDNLTARRDSLGEARDGARSGAPNDAVRNGRAVVDGAKLLT